MAADCNALWRWLGIDLRFEPERDGDGEVGGDGLAILVGGFVAILLEGFHSGFVEGWRTGEDFHGFDLTGFVDEGVQSDIAGPELAKRVAGSDGADGFYEARRSDGAVVDGWRGRVRIGGFGIANSGVFCNRC